MQKFSMEFKNMLDETPVKLASCFKIIRKDGVGKFFTNYDEELLICGDYYKPASGFLPSDIDYYANLGGNNAVEIMGLLKDISATDLRLGLYDFAEIEIFQVNYENISAGKISLFNGNFGKITFKNNHFYAELTSLSARLNRGIISNYSPFCRSNLGDDLCRKDLSDFTATATITQVINNKKFFTNSLSQDTGFFSNGKIEFTTGGNAGLITEVKFNEKLANGFQKISLILPTSFVMKQGDDFKLTAGCDKSFHTCRKKFNNAINFRGEPHLPGIDAIAKIEV